MNVRVYMRVAEGENGDRARAGVQPNYEPLSERRGASTYYLPTAFFAIDVEVPDEVLRAAETLAATVEVAADDVEVIVKPVRDIAPEATT